MKCKYLSDGFIKTIRIPDRFLDLLKKDEETIKTWQPVPKWIVNNESIPNGCIKELARTYIIINGITVERLNNISIEESKSEGILPMLDEILENQIFYPRYDLKELFPYFKENEAIQSFKSLWEPINGKNSFNNEWVLVLSLKKITEEEFKKSNN
jgi:hypothetical protein